MLNFYLFGMFLVGCIIVYDILFNELVEKVLKENKNVPNQYIAIGLTIAVAFVLLLSWVVVIQRTHNYLMKTF